MITKITLAVQKSLTFWLFLYIIVGNNQKRIVYVKREKSL